MLDPAALRRFLAAPEYAMMVRITSHKGSAPCKSGAFMLVNEARIFGTIGGGRLEHVAICHARDMLRDGRQQDEMSFSLNVQSGQCCGGHAVLSFAVVDKAVTKTLEAALETIWSTRPSLYIFGAGHVGRALANAAHMLPMNTLVVDSREAEIVQLNDGIAWECAALPEVMIHAAPAKSAFVMTTHEHSLDYLLTAEALRRGDAAYIGMIGSKTKRARFFSWYKETYAQPAPEGLQCPIGAAAPKNNAPSVIAAFALTEIASVLLSHDGV